MKYAPVCLQRQYEQYVHLYKLGRISDAKQRFRKSIRRAKKLDDDFTDLAELSRCDPDHRFVAVVDRYLFAQRVLKETPPQASAFSESELTTAYAGMLTEFMVIASRARPYLALQGLEKKILAKIKQGIEHPEAPVFTVPIVRDMGVRFEEWKSLGTIKDILCFKCRGELLAAAPPVLRARDVFPTDTKTTSACEVFGAGVYDAPPVPGNGNVPLSECDGTEM